MKTCLIYQPCGLGDILWIQPIVNALIKQNYTVYFPVVELYHDMLQKHIKKNNLMWVNEKDTFPLKEYYGKESFYKDENNLYIPISFANYMLPNCSNMMSKYYIVGMPISNWHSSFEIDRDHDKEKYVFDTYGLSKDENYCLINESYGTPPNYKQRKIDVNSNIKQIHLSYELNKKNGINLFDCIGLIESAKEIHSVETSVCYLIDKYAKTENIFMYEKRLESENNTFYKGDNRVYRNINWTYQCF
jgi:hypothetical protein